MPYQVVVRRYAQWMLWAAGQHWLEEARRNGSTMHKNHAVRVPCERACSHAHWHLTCKCTWDLNLPASVDPRWGLQPWRPVYDHSVLQAFRTGGLPDAAQRASAADWPGTGYRWCRTSGTWQSIPSVPPAASPAGDFSGLSAARHLSINGSDSINEPPKCTHKHPTAPGPIAETETLCPMSGCPAKGNLASHAWQDSLHCQPVI